MDQTEGQVTLVADAKTDRILGVQILCAHSPPTLIAEGGGGDGVFPRAARTSLARSTRTATLPEAIKEAALARRGEGRSMCKRGRWRLVWIVCIASTMTLFHGGRAARKALPRGQRSDRRRRHSPSLSEEQKIICIDGIMCAG